MKYIVNISVTLIFLLSCSGSDGTGPSQSYGTRGWIVGEAPSSSLTILHTKDGTDWSAQGDTLDFDGTSLTGVSLVGDTPN